MYKLIKNGGYIRSMLSLVFTTSPYMCLDWLLAKMKKRHVSFYEDNAKPGRLLPTTLGATRRTYAPLDIVGLPKYDQLSNEERQICSDIRVVPQIYLQIKQIMVQECLKQDGLKLADIRPIVKIDVNKTRKLYDYFLQKELIYQNNFQENDVS